MKFSRFAAGLFRSTVGPVFRKDAAKAAELFAAYRNSGTAWYQRTTPYVRLSNFWQIHGRWIKLVVFVVLFVLLTIYAAVHHPGGQ